MKTISRVLGQASASLSHGATKQRTSRSRSGCISASVFPKCFGSKPMPATLIRTASTPPATISARSSDWSLCHRYASGVSPRRKHLLEGVRYSRADLTLKTYTCSTRTL